MNKYLDKGLTEEEVKRGLRKRTIAGEIVPMLCGSAFKNKGVQAMLDAVIDYLPAPIDIPPVKGAKEEAAKIDPELADNPLIFPDDETLSNVAIFDSKALSNQDYLEKWQALIGS